MAAGSAHALRLRPATPADSAFAYETKKAAFRKYAEQVWGWDEGEQRRLHARRFATQEVFVLEVGGDDVGVLSMTRAPDCLHVEQLFVLPAHQGAGIGAACIALVTERAGKDRLPIRLQVLKVNPAAQRFFARHGFQPVDETPTHVELERPADGGARPVF